MTSVLDNHEEESFIILGTSPGTSLDMKCNGDVSLDKKQIEDAMKDLSVEANMALKAHFKLGDCPSPASLMVASTIITDDKSTEELQKRFGEILDENVILKETLKQNNDSMKEQFLLIASCQEDMMKTHTLHKEKFEETKELVEKLRQENKKLKQDMSKLTESFSPKVPSLNVETAELAKSGPPSALEFVTSPDDDTMDKLTAQLDLVEKQRRQVIVENEKLTWQKESLEHIVDATSKERDDLKEKLKVAELKLALKDSETADKIHRLNTTIKDLQSNLQSASNSSSEIQKRDEIISQLENKVKTLQNDMRAMQMQILELENIRLEYTKFKSEVSDQGRMYNSQIQDLQNRLKDAQTTVFQPVRVSLNSESDSMSSDDTSFSSNIKLYDRTLKHLAELFDLLTNGLSDSLVQTLGVVASLSDFKLGKATADQVKSGLTDVKQQLERQHSTALSNISQVKGTISIFEVIFKEYNELLRKASSKPEITPGSNVEALTAALVARGEQIQQLETELTRLKNHKEDGELLKAQLDLYKSDFEAERESREKMASEKENILTDLRTTQKLNHELAQQLEEVRKINPVVYRTATTRKPTAPVPKPAPKPAPTAPRASTTTTTTTGNMVYTCPKCMRFSCDNYHVMEDHFDFCLDDF